MDKVLFYSNSLQRELEVEAINLKANTFVVRVDKRLMTLDGADKLFDRIRAEARAEAARDLPEYGWQKRFRETYGIPWDRALSNREAQLHDACKLGWELARAAILADEPKESNQCLKCGKQCPNGCPMDKPKEESESSWEPMVRAIIKLLPRRERGWLKGVVDAEVERRIEEAWR